MAMETHCGELVVTFDETYQVSEKSAVFGGAIYRRGAWLQLERKLRILRRNAVTNRSIILQLQREQRVLEMEDLTALFTVDDSYYAEFARFLLELKTGRPLKASNVSDG